MRQWPKTTGGSRPRTGSCMAHRLEDIRCPPPQDRGEVWRVKYCTHFSVLNMLRARQSMLALGCTTDPLTEEADPGTTCSPPASCVRTSQRGVSGRRYVESSWAAAVRRWGERAATRATRAESFTPPGAGKGKVEREAHTKTDDAAVDARREAGDLQVMRQRHRSRF